MNLSIYRICLQGLVLAALAVGASPAVRMRKLRVNPALVPSAVSKIIGYQAPFAQLRRQSAALFCF